MFSRFQRTKRSVVSMLLALAALFVLTLATSPSVANDTEAFLEEQEVLTKAALAQWVEDKAKKNVTAQIAVQIVEAAFEQASKHRIDPLLVLAMMRNESEYDRFARSKENARGLMQVIGYWHRDKIRGRDLTNIQVNVEVGTRILHDCLVKHKENVDRAMGCYSGGGGKTYRNKIAKQHSAIRTFLVEYQFSRDQPVVATNTFDEPRQKARTNPLDTMIALVSHSTQQ